MGGRALADKLMGSFERGDYRSAAALFAKDGKVVTQYGPKVQEMTVDQFLASGEKGPLKNLGKPKYLDRRVVELGNAGFLEQHTTQLQVGGKPVYLPAVLVVRCNSRGEIAVLEEYLDPSPLMKAMGLAAKAAKSAKAAAEAAAEKRGVPEGLVVVVTGASSGIGEHIAYQYARRKGAVVLAGRREAELDRVAKSCHALSAHCRTLVVPTDVASRAACANLVAQAVKHFGQIDRLYLNAGASQSSPMADASESLVQNIMDTNFFGSAYTAQVALPHLAQGARITVVSSLLGKLVAPNQAGYCASKWALHGYFGALRLELQPQGRTVTIACPGPVRTGILGNLEGPRGERTGFQIDSSQLDEMMLPDEAARRTVVACEAGRREVIVGSDELAGLVRLSSKNPDQVDKILSAMYNNLHKTRQGFAKSHL